MTWRPSAACRDSEVDIFFPERYADETVQPALAICAACPVRQECLEEALLVPQRDDRDGIFGGTTPQDRRLFRRTRHTIPRHDRVTEPAAD